MIVLGPFNFNFKIKISEKYSKSESTVNNPNTFTNLVFRERGFYNNVPKSVLKTIRRA